ncbi:MAG: guanylate kinase [Anaerolineae bacterium]|nr:guanylate kinase [Anaerolineae bacterium]
MNQTAGNQKTATHRYLEPPPLLLIISGPSGVGKDTVIAAMREAGLPFHFVVTSTTRPPRPGEVDGADYIFVERDQFERMIEEDELIEYAVVYGQYKGIPKQHVRDALASGQDVVMRLDVQGAETVKRLIPEAISVFLIAPSMEILERRLRSRKSDTPDQIQVRLAKAHAEMEAMERFDFVVPNRESQVDRAVADIAAILRAERLRVGRPPVSL